MGIIGLNHERNTSHPVFSTSLLLSPQRMLGGSFRCNETATLHILNPSPFSFWRNCLTRNQADSLLKFQGHTLGRTPLKERPLPTQHIKNTRDERSCPQRDFFFRTRNPSNRVAADLRLWPHGHRDWRLLPYSV